jgi:hypothetical protein
VRITEVSQSEVLQQTTAERIHFRDDVYNIYLYLFLLLLKKAKLVGYGKYDPKYTFQDSNFCTGTY